MPKVLIVDDALADRVRVSGIASSWLNCTVLEADNGRTALDQIEEHHPDLVLTDLNMPEMDGLQLVAAVKQDFPDIPVVLMTAQGSEDIAAEALRAGAASYVPKVRLGEDLIPTLTQVYHTAQVSDTESRLMHYMRVGHNEFEIPNDPGLIKSCVSQVLNMLRCLPLGDEAERLRVGIAFQEAIFNAYYHGNLEVSTQAGNDSSQFHDVALSRHYEEPYMQRRIHISTDITPQQAQFTVRDDGAGFDTTKMKAQPTMRGRGITLMETVMDEVDFNDVGNEVRMIKKAIRNEDDD